MPTRRPVKALSNSALKADTSPPSQTSDLPLQPGSGQGRRHGTSSNEPFDRWFRYPAGFASDYVSVLLHELELEPGGLVVDPFAGSAVTGTAARAAGLSFFGIEAHPLISELGRLKLQTPPGRPAELASVAREIARMYSASPNDQDLDAEASLIRRCFSDPILTQLVALRNAIKSGVGEPWSDYLKWALLATLRDVAGVRVGWPYQRPGTDRRPPHADAFTRFERRVSWMAADLDEYSKITELHTSKLVNGDSRDPESWSHIAPTQAHGCVSSPPYLNNFDYADATRLELYFWGEVTTWSQMVSTVRSEMITATTQQSSVGSAALATSALRELGPTATSIDILVQKLHGERTSRSRGKEYDRVLPAYFLAISQVLSNLAGTLAPGAPAVWLVGDSAPYGVYVDTPGIIAELAQHAGLSLEKDVVLRRRGQRWAGNSSRHGIELAERLILMRRNQQ